LIFVRSLAGRADKKLVARTVRLVERRSIPENGGRAFGPEGWTDPLVVLLRPWLFPAVEPGEREFYGVSHAILEEVAGLIDDEDDEGSIRLLPGMLDHALIVGSSIPARVLYDGCIFDRSREDERIEIRSIHILGELGGGMGRALARAIEFGMDIYTANDHIEIRPDPYWDPSSH